MLGWSVGGGGVFVWQIWLFPPPPPNTHITALAAAPAPQVVRCFDDADVIHVSGKVDPLDDTDVINFELALADIGQIEKRMDRLRKTKGKSGEEAKRNEVEAGALERILAALERNLPARSVALGEEEAELGGSRAGQGAGVVWVL